MVFDECVCVCTGGGFQRLRAHLYGSLLYYLQIAQKPEEPDTLQSGIGHEGFLSF